MAEYFETEEVTKGYDPVIAGRIRAVRLLDDETHRGTTLNALPTGPGRLLDLRDIEQGLENLKRVPTAEADIQIAPGQQLGETGDRRDLGGHEVRVLAGRGWSHVRGALSWRGRGR